jgi:hypothetical protein
MAEVYYLPLNAAFLIASCTVTSAVVLAVLTLGQKGKATV